MSICDECDWKSEKVSLACRTLRVAMDWSLPCLFTDGAYVDTANMAVVQWTKTTRFSEDDDEKHHYVQGESSRVFIWYSCQTEAPM